MSEWENWVNRQRATESPPDGLNTSPVVDPSPTPQSPSPSVSESAFSQWGRNQAGNDFPMMDVPEKTGLSQSDVISDPSSLATIRAYMVDRKGVDYEDAPPEKVVDDYISHWRYVETGEIPLVGEIYYTNRADPEAKERAANAFQIYQQINPFWKEGPRESLEAIGDYALAAIRPDTSPSTILSLGAGKIAASTVGKKLGMEALKASFRSGTQTAAQKMVAQKAIRNVERKAALGGLAASSVVDASVAGLSDYQYQTQLEGEFTNQPYSLSRTLLVSGLAGGGTGALGAIPYLGKGKLVGINPDDIELQRVLTKQIGATKAGSKLISKVGKVAKALSNSDWAKAVAAGQQSDLRESEARMLVESFLDPKDPDSIVSILDNAGVRIRFEEDKTTSGIINYLINMPPNVLNPIKQSWQQHMGNVPFEDGMKELAASMESAGYRQSLASQAKRTLEEWYSTGIKNGSNNVDKLSPQTLRYMQSLWKRAVVSSIPTTAVNVKGWGLAYGTRMADDFAQIFTRPLIGALDSVRTLSPKPLFKGSRDSVSLARSLAYRTMNIMDPYGTKEAWDAAMAAAPKSVKALLTRETFGGVGQYNPAQLYHMPDNTLVRGVENMSDWASRLTMIDLQDRWTRALSGFSELDKQSRLRFRKSYAQLVKDGEEHLLDDKVFQEVVRTSLEDTFSFDYSRGRDILNRMAGLVQTASNTPIVGFAIPFGKFMNNIVAFSSYHSPLGAIEIAKQLMKHNNDEASEALAKATVGTVALAMIGKWSYDKMIEDQTQWNEVSGVDVQNVAPASQYILAGRMWEMIQNNQTPPREMWVDLAKQLSVGEYANVASGPSVLIDTINAIGRGSEEEYQKGLPAMKELLKGTVELVGTIGSGYTRPFDTINDLVGMANESNAQIDRRQAFTVGEKFLGEFTRYMDSVLAPYLGEGQPPLMGEAARMTSRPEGDIRDPNPTSTQLGTRLLQSRNYTDHLLGAVNLPPWRIDSRTAIPEFDRVINTLMAPRLNSRAKGMLANDNWKNAHQDIKLKLVRDMISEIKSQVLDEIEAGLHGTDPMLFNERRLFTYKDRPLRDEAKINYGWSHIHDRELSFDQLRILNEYISYQEKNYDVLVEGLSR